MKTATQSLDIEQNNRRVAGSLLAIIALLMVIAIVSIVTLN